MLPVFKRNFTAYFLNPTGYVFICVFVLLSSIAAFLPDEFVNSNLANLAQLNLWYPLIQLVFIPAITMGIWADERRQGTEELLMTMPLSSGQIVLGKYLASTGIYTISLLVSAISNLAILEFLGNPDIGLFLSTYLGYWLIGLTMLSIAAVASFLTSQLTVAYILGALFNIPLIALQWADAIPVSRQTALFLKSFSIDSFFQPFGRGIVSLAGICYFLLIPVIMLYLCMILLNRRTWTSRKPKTFFCHYLFRIVALTLIFLALVQMVHWNDVQIDWTAEKLSSLSPATKTLIKNSCGKKYPIIIEAYLSPSVPQEFIQTRLNIISVLNEIKNQVGPQVFLDIYDIQPNTELAYRLERQYDIRPEKVIFDTRGRVREESIYLSIIFRYGSRTAVIPFLNRGLSVEYELTNALMMIGDRPRKRIGILKTDAGLLGRFDEYGREIQKQWPIIDELSKQYIIESVDPAAPIPNGRYDVLLAVQPSSLGPLEMVNFSNALRTGQATVLFEDPYPVFVEYLPGTKIPKRPTAQSPLPPPKGELNMIWAMLGLNFDTSVLWKNYNPYPKLAGLSEEYIFVDARPIHFDIASSAKEKTDETKKSKAAAPVKEPQAFNTEDICVASLEHLLFPFTGSLQKGARAETDFHPLIQTEAAGLASVEKIVPNRIQSYCQDRMEKEGVYILAAKITGKVPRAFLPTGITGKNPEFNVIVVADVDLLTPGFFSIREMGTDVRSGITLDFDNVTFVMNAIDQMAGDNDLIPIRSRRPRHRTLSTIEETTQKIRDKASVEQIAYLKEFEKERQEEAAELQKTFEAVNHRVSEDPDYRPSQKETLELQTAWVAAQQRLNLSLEEKKQKYNRKVEESQREVDEYVRTVQGRYKLYAILFPPIFPLLIGCIVFAYRKRQQQSRRRKNIRVDS